MGSAGTTHGGRREEEGGGEEGWRSWGPGGCSQGEATVATCLVRYKSHIETLVSSPSQSRRSYASFARNIHLCLKYTQNTAARCLLCPSDARDDSARRRTGRGRAEECDDSGAGEILDTALGVALIDCFGRHRRRNLLPTTPAYPDPGTPASSRAPPRSRPPVPPRTVHLFRALTASSSNSFPSHPIHVHAHALL